MYMDDGTVHHNCRDFCFECFSYDEQKMFCNWLKEKFNLEARVIRYDKKKEKGFRTRIIKKSVLKFKEIISPYMIKEMQYKI